MGSSSYYYQSMCINYVNSAIFCATYMTSQLFTFILNLCIPKEDTNRNVENRLLILHFVVFISKNEIGNKFSKRVENIVGNGEIAHHGQFLISHSVFKRLVQQTCKNKGLFGRVLKMYS